ncbi:MAG: GH3 auxin-responsive promoter family protein [Dehalococcoidia bacterium]|jgi:hypothetical protein
MASESELFRQSRLDELWQRCCGFIDLSLQEFTEIQRRLLMEQLELLKKCELGRVIMDGAAPRNVTEFREQVPLTTYADYAPYLLKRRMDVLPRKPILWQYTSGKSGEYPYMWAPVTARQLEEIQPLLFALLFFASGNGRQEISIREHDRIFYGMAPPPYATGSMTRAFPHELFNFLPPIDMAEEMSFEDRMKKGFEMAITDGIDLCFALSSLAIGIGERFSQNSGKTNLKPLLSKPKALFRLGKGLLKSKLARRTMLPKDIWNLKGLITFGIDGAVYKEKIKEMWGRYPLDFHGCTEAVLIATQTWDHQGMTFFPNLNFLEFIPEEECLKAAEDPLFQPHPLLIDEIKPGNYELVITSFHGGPFIRYRLGHLVKIHSLRNEELDIDIPQMSFIARVDDMIDIAGFTRLSEKTIWRAIENSGLNYNGWTARKEVKEKPLLHLYMEMGSNGHLTGTQVAAAVHEELKKLNKPYAEMEDFIKLQPLQVTLLPANSFRNYEQAKKKAGAKGSQVYVPHINPSESTIDSLLHGPQPEKVEATSPLEAVHSK